MKTLHTLFLDELADMYDAEHRLLKALPKMVKAATHDELKEAFQAHLTQTEGQAETLELVFEAFDAEARGKKCAAMVGLLEEADEIAEDNEDSPAINAALISAAQKVEHYEIASYGCLRTWAELLGNSKAAKMLGEILAQERAADELLTQIAIRTCNPAAKERVSESQGSKNGKDPARTAPPSKKVARAAPAPAVKAGQAAAGKAH